MSSTWKSEQLCALDQLPADGFRFSAVAPRVVGGTSFPVRAYARLEEPARPAS